jgi:tetratricopeptide (TPR) repeat protein
MAARRVLTALCRIPALAIVLAAAAPPFEVSAEELIRQANAAFAREDFDESNRLYEAAEVVSADPGLVAFNRGAVMFKSQRYAEAARYYLLVLNDAACPPERAAKAWYNRGTCLLRQSGATTTVYRSAIACLERAFDSAAADAALKANARHNLELAKMLWNEARKKENKQDNPNNDLPPEDPRSEPPQRPLGSDSQIGEPDGSDGGGGGTQVPKIVQQPVAGAGMKATPSNGQAPAPGATGQIQPLEDKTNIQPLSPEETREHLRRTAERLRRDQQIMRMTLYGAERAGLHDW